VAGTVGDLIYVSAPGSIYVSMGGSIQAYAIRFGWHRFGWHRFGWPGFG
jgi:hypothetical protein